MATRRRNNRSRRDRRHDSPASSFPVATAPASAAPAGATWRRDTAHLALMLAALGVSYLLPFELFVLSYAVLGPLHYLTEISWLHDRKYFPPNRHIAALLCLIALGAMFMANASALGIVVSVTFVGCAILALALPRKRTVIFLLIAAVVFAMLWLLDVPFGLAWLLIPTLIHVSVFTLVFMLVGAIRSRSVTLFLLMAAYVLAVAAILLFPPSRSTVMPELARVGKDYFGDLAPALGGLVGVPNLAFDGRITGLLSFVYTYHYLNWFIKVDVIRWAAVPKSRMAAIVLLSLSATGLYFYNYTYGFMVLLLLSLIHVLLEFPLNSISLRQLGGALGRSSKRPGAVARAGA
jgi:hypothetical protein